MSLINGSFLTCIKISQVDTLDFAPNADRHLYPSCFGVNALVLLAADTWLMAEVDSVFEFAPLQDTPGSRITSDNLDHAKQRARQLFHSRSGMWLPKQHHYTTGYSSNSFIPRRRFKKEDRLEYTRKISRIFLFGASLAL